MRSVLLPLIALLGLSLSFPGESAAKKIATPRGQIVVKAKLTGLSHAPACGVLHTAAVMRYEVLSVISGKHTGTILYAVYDCGNVAGTRTGAGVKVGDIHRLTVKPIPANFGGSLVDAFAADKGTRFLAVRADTAKP